MFVICGVLLVVCWCSLFAVGCVMSVDCCMRDVVAIVVVVCCWLYFD